MFIIPTAMLVRCCLFRVGYPPGVIGFSLSLLADSVVICLQRKRDDSRLVACTRMYGD
jgi:hypothetical protein